MKLRITPFDDLSDIPSTRIEIDQNFTVDDMLTKLHKENQDLDITDCKVIYKGYIVCDWINLRDLGVQENDQFYLMVKRNQCCKAGKSLDCNANCSIFQLN